MFFLLFFFFFFLRFPHKTKVLQKLKLHTNYKMKSSFHREKNKAIDQHLIINIELLK